MLIFQFKSQLLYNMQLLDNITNKINLFYYLLYEYYINKDLS